MKKELRIALTCCGATVVFCAAAALWPIISPITGDEMGWCVIFYYFLFPILAFLCGGILGAFSLPRCLGFGAGYMALAAVCGFLMPWTAFRSFWPEVALCGAICAAIGFILRLLVKTAFSEGRENDK